MPSAFDRLAKALRLGMEVLDGKPAAKARKGDSDGPLIPGSEDDDDDIADAALDGQEQSDRDAAQLDDAPRRRAASSKPKRKLLTQQEGDRMLKAATAISRDVAKLRADSAVDTRALAAERMRETARRVMEEAKADLAAGRITPHQAALIEARVIRSMDAADSAGGR